MYSPGVWLPLDGTTKTVWDRWQADTDRSEGTRRLETWSAAAFSPGATVELEGWDGQFVRYTSFITYEIDTRDADTDTYVKRDYTLTSYYAANGLLTSAGYEMVIVADDSTDPEHEPELGIGSRQLCQLTRSSMGFPEKSRP